MKLEVGMYVRTNEGIGTVQRIYNNKNGCTVRFKKGHVKKWVTIFKASNNIIDLIEEGDYVNGWLVEEIRNDRVISSQYEFCDICNDFERKEILKEDIKSTVTKEQFSSMKYRLGE